MEAYRAGPSLIVSDFRPISADITFDIAHVPTRPPVHTGNSTGQNMEAISVSINDAAKALGVGRTSIYSMIADGRLEAFKLGRRRLVTVASIQRLAAAAQR